MQRASGRQGPVDVVAKTLMHKGVSVGVFEPVDAKPVGVEPVGAEPVGVEPFGVMPVGV